MKPPTLRPGYQTTSPRRSGELTRIERAVTAGGRAFDVDALPDGSDLKGSYREVLDRIDRVRQNVALYGQMLAAAIEAIDLSRLPVAERPDRTEIVLSLEPMTGFVGDTISFQGTLTSPHGPLAQRDVDILLNSSTNVTVVTDAAGEFQGELEIPYWYQPEIAVEALYRPEAADEGRLLASLSPAVRLRVQFYPAKIELEPEARAYPGRPTGLDIRFDYAGAPAPAKREVEVYLDGQPVADATTVAAAGSTFRLDIPPEATEGIHTVTVSAAATGRYAPSLASVPLAVSRAVPRLDLRLPRFIIVPGTLKIEGRLYSELGLLEGTPVELTFGRSHINVRSQADGALSARIVNRGIDLGIVGYEDVTVLVAPAEPWHAPLTASRAILVVNAVNGSALVIIIAVLGYLSAPAVEKAIRKSRAREAPATPAVRNPVRHPQRAFRR